MHRKKSELSRPPSADEVQMTAVFILNVCGTGVSTSNCLRWLIRTCEGPSISEMESAASPVSEGSRESCIRGEHPKIPFPLIALQRGRASNSSCGYKYQLPPPLKQMYRSLSQYFL